MCREHGRRDDADEIRTFASVKRDIVASEFTTRGTLAFRRQQRPSVPRLVAKSARCIFRPFRRSGFATVQPVRTSARRERMNDSCCKIRRFSAIHLDDRFRYPIASSVMPRGACLLVSLGGYRTAPPVASRQKRRTTTTLGSQGIDRIPQRRSPRKVVQLPASAGRSAMETEKSSSCCRIVVSSASARPASPHHPPPVIGRRARFGDRLAPFSKRPRRRRFGKPQKGTAAAAARSFQA